MSKNIIIQEGAVGQNFTTKKLKTDLAGGGACLWVPKDEVQLGTKNITENGTYKASKDGFYGYSQVTVNVQGGGNTITGKDPETGQETVVGTDPTTGEIVETVVPVEIRVITPPTNPYGIYKDGQTIVKDGMVVKAYDANGDEMQTVPIGEITINPTTAVYDPDTDPHDYYNQLVTPPDGLIPGNVQIRVKHGTNFSYEANVHMTEFISINQPASICRPLNGIPTIACADSPIIVDSYYTYDGQEGGHNIARYTDSYTYNGKTAYYAYNNAYYNFIPPQDDLSNTVTPGVLAWSMLYGEIEDVPAGSRQTISVSWPRTGDGKILETTFVILVAPPIYGGGDA